ncbi:CoA pyrophosphatase [Tenacibaculum sp. UWU-22]|uniref:NUDIX hydrolase n=1 Tax=Tenacibaculum sp. UWU-22 TaxID=3234187 RepID=UPI0034DAC05D
MNFDSFLSKINLLKVKELGGLKTQYKLAPATRLQYTPEKIKNKNPKKAAVLALFYPDKNNKTTFLLTKRASYNGTHSGQISFPGGKTEKTDLNLQETALRETYEEVGVSTPTIKVIRELTDIYIPPSNFLATPFIAYTNTQPNFKYNSEVAELIEVLASDLLNKLNLTSAKISTPYMKNVTVPCFKLNNYVVWGATAMILAEIKELLIS